MATTPNMGMTLPEPSVTDGPTWAEQVNAALEDQVDAHDHTEGKGAPIPAAALNIDGDLPLNGNNLTTARMLRMDNQTATLSGTTDIRGFYVVDGDVYYNNGAGTAVQITDGNTLAASSFGAFTNLPSTAYPNASAAWVDGYPGFSFFQNTNVYARMRTASIEVHEAGATSPNAVTVKSPAGLAADYDLTLPTALPASSSFLVWSSTGAVSSGPAVSGGIDTTNLANSAVTTAKIADSNVTTAKIADANVTRAKLAAVGQQVSASCGSFSTTASSLTSITNLSVSITTTGRPVLVFCQSDGATASHFQSKNTLGPETEAYIYLRRAGSAIAVTKLYNIVYNGLGAEEPFATAPPSAVLALDVPSAGTYTYDVLVDNVTASGNVFSADGIVLVAYEL